MPKQMCYVIGLCDQVDIDEVATKYIYNIYINIQFCLDSD